MPNTLSPVEKLSHSTVRIECDYTNGQRGTGTGFFYNFAREGNKHVPAIVTNSHVIRGSKSGSFVLTLGGNDGAPLYGSTFRFTFSNFEAYWTFHPDLTVDLCAMPIASLFETAGAQGKRILRASFDESLLPTSEDVDDFFGLEQITMIGYPNGLWDEVNNLPLFRRGVLASNYKTNWNGKREFLIDAACFPGSSGSPVLLFNEGFYSTRKEPILMNTGGPRIKLLGILYAGPQHTIEGDVQIINVPIHQKPVAISAIPINLGIVIKSERLKEFDAVLRT